MDDGRAQKDGEEDDGEREGAACEEGPRPAADWRRAGPRGNASKVERQLRDKARKIAGAGAAALGRIRRELHTGETAAELRRRLDELLREKKLGFAVARKPRG